MLIKQINPKSSKSSALLISDCVGLCGGKVEPCSYTLELPVDSIVNSISIKDLNGDIYSIIGLNIQAPFKRLPREIYKLAYTLGFIATKQNWFSLAYSQDTSIFQFSCLSEAVLVSVTTSTGDIPFIKKCSPLDPEASFDFRVCTTYSGHFLIDGIPLFNFAYDDWISESPRLFVCDVVIRSIDGTVQNSSTVGPYPVDPNGYSLKKLLEDITALSSPYSIYLLLGNLFSIKYRTDLPFILHLRIRGSQSNFSDTSPQWTAISYDGTTISDSIYFPPTVSVPESSKPLLCDVENIPIKLPLRQCSTPDTFFNFSSDAAYDAYIQSLGYSFGSAPRQFKCDSLLFDGQANLIYPGTFYYATGTSQLNYFLAYITARTLPKFSVSLSLDETTGNINIGYDPAKHFTFVFNLYLADDVGGYVFAQSFIVKYADGMSSPTVEVRNSIFSGVPPNDGADLINCVNLPI